MNLIKLQDTKLIYRNLLYFYILTTYTNCTLSEISEREIKQTIPFTIASERLKYLGIKLPKEAIDRYSENWKMLMKEIEDNAQMERYTMYLDWKNQYC